MPHLQPLMRADFTLFDEYEHTHEGAAPFAFPVTAFWGSCDRRIKHQMVQVRRGCRGWPQDKVPALGGVHQ